MQENTLSKQQDDLINLAFTSTTLEALIRSGKLHVADFHCLDETSKKGVWSLIRSAASGRIYR